MEDVLDNVAEVIPPEKTEETPKPLTDQEFIDKDHDEGKETPSEQAEEELKEEKVEEKIEEKVEEDEELKAAPITAKALVSRIKEADPTFFKKNPEVRDAIFQASQYSELFSHPDEAKAVVENYQNFENLAQGILEGKADQLLHTIDTTNKSSVKLFAESFPKALYNLDKTTFYETLASPILTSALNEALASATKSGNENLKRSIAHISQFLFDSPTIPRKQQSPIDPEKIELQKKLQQTQIERYSDVKEEVQGVAYSDVVRDIAKDVPKDVNPKLRDAYVREVMDTLEGTLQNDQNHIRRMNNLWDSLVSSGFSNRGKKQLYDAWTSRAKLVLPGIITQVKPSYFTNGAPKKVVTKEQIPQGGSGSTKSAKVSPGKIDWSKTSDLDILNKTPKLKP